MHDPPELHAAAERLGRLVGRGLIGYGEAMDAMMWAIFKRFPDIQPTNEYALSSRISVTLSRAAESWDLTANAEVRAAVKEQIDKRQKRMEIMRHAHLANRYRLSRQDVDAIAREEIEAVIARIKAAKNAR